MSLWGFRSVVVSLVLLSGCATAQLPKVAYEKPPTVSSNHLGVITVKSGKIDGSMASSAVPVGGIFVPTGGGASPTPLNFNQEDQMIFAACLSEELERLGIMKFASAANQFAQPSIGLDILFNRTTKYPGGEYYLDVSLVIRSGKEQAVKQYKVRSFEGLSRWESFNVLPMNAKRMAAQHLLNAMVPDIEAAVRSMPASNI